MMPIALPSPSSPERNRLVLNALEARKLDRLYRRRHALDELIRSLEAYVECQEAVEPECLDSVAS